MQSLLIGLGCLYQIGGQYIPHLVLQTRSEMVLIRNRDIFIQKKIA